MSESKSQPNNVVNRGTGAGGSNTNKNGKPLEDRVNKIISEKYYTPPCLFFASFFEFLPFFRTCKKGRGCMNTGGESPYNNRLHCGTDQKLKLLYLRLHNTYASCF